ncbi:MAG: multidrug DMT transporter permease [candidate division KSB1 bacterium]|nr:multidrug DMT transporter permease [candidate division KSB1 bacterium]
MVVVQSYAIAVAMCFVTMLCWGSWANTQKLASKEWRFQLFYWDYALGVLLLSVILAFTMGSFGSAGRSFLPDLAQAGGGALTSAFVGGIVFNFANILLVVAIDIAGMAVAFPVGIGLALAIGVITNYIAVPVGNPVVLFIGVACVVAAIILDAVAYKKLSSGADEQKSTAKGLIFSIVAGVAMGFFYRFVAASMSTDFVNPVAGKMTPYTAVVVFSVGLLLSNFIFNTILMRKPVAGEPVAYRDYFIKGNPRLHLIGILGGVIWSLGMSFNIIAAGEAGFAISYGLGQGATMIAALWGVFIWKEFRNAPKGTKPLITLMFIFFVIGLGLIIYARVA